MVLTSAALSAGLLLVVWLVELWQIVWPLPAISLVGTAGLAAFVALSLVRAARHIRVLFIVVVSVSAVIAAFLAEPSVLYRGFEKAQIFGAFLPSVLMLRATVETSTQLSQLQRGVQSLSRHGADNWTFYGSHSLGAILNVGALAILAPVIARDADAPRRLALASSAARGVGSAIMWSPFFVAMAFTSQLVPAAQLWKLMLIGAALALIGCLLSYLMFTPSLGLRGFGRSLLGLRPLLAPTAVMVAAVLLSTSLFGLSGLQAVSISVPVLCLAYLLTAGRAQWVATLRRTLSNFSTLSNELLIVVGATVLGVAVSSVPAVQAMAGSVTPSMLSGTPLIVGLIALLVGFGLLGLHPMIGASLLAPTLAAGPFGLSAEIVVCTIVFAWALSATVSIWTLPVAAAASTFGVPVQQISTRRSYLYALIYAVGAIVVLASVNAAMQR